MMHGTRIRETATDTRPAILALIGARGVRILKRLGDATFERDRASGEPRPTEITRARYMDGLRNEVSALTRRLEDLKRETRR